LTAESLACPVCGAAALKPPAASSPPRPGPAADLAATIATVGPAAPVPVPALPGCPTVPGYEILSELGRGGMGVVYQARQVQLNRLVALKMILSGGHAGEEERTRFRVEAEAVARLQHPGIVQIYEIGESEGRPFFSLEFVEGGNLDRKIAGTPLAARQAATLIETLARAVHAAHQKGIVHRDLKPANVLLTADGTPKITDFGLAKYLDSERGQTQSGAILGTPSYMAPEQASGRGKAVGPATDVYALGAILYECLTGRPPFKAETPLDTLMQVMSEEPLPPSRLQPKVPRDLEPICLKCLEKAPARRYGSALALAEDLRCWLAGEPTQARPVGTWGRLAKWARRRPAVAGLLAAVVGVAAVGLGLVLWQWQRAEGQRRRAEQQSRLAEKQRGLAEQQSRLADRRRRQAVAARQTAEQRVAENYLERGLAACNTEGDAALGVLWLARALEAVPAHEANLDHVIRTNLTAWCRGLHPLRAVLPHAGQVQAVAFSPDGKTILTGSGEEDRGSGEARLWSAATGQPLLAPLRHQGPVTAVAFSPDGKTVCTGSWDDTARLWSAVTGQPLTVPLKHLGTVWSVVFSRDGKTVLTRSGDLGKGEVRLWSAATGRELTPPLRHPRGIMAVALSPDGQEVLTGSGAGEMKPGEARLWSAATGQPLGPPLKHQGPVTAAAFSPDGKAILTGSEDGTAQLWKTPSGQPLGPLLRHQGPVTAVAFGPDGQTVLTASGSWEDSSGEVRLWSAATGEPLTPPLHHQERVSVVAFSRSGAAVLTGSLDNTARLWDPATGQPLGPPLRHQGPVTAVAFSPDGKTVLTAGGDEARLWSAATGTAFRPPLRHRDWVTGVAISRDGKGVLTGSLDGTAQLWSAATGQPLGKPLQHQKPVQAAAFSPDGKVLLTGGNDGAARLWWFTEKGEPVNRPLHHQARVQAVAFSPDGKTVLTGSRDRTAQLWLVATGLRLASPLRHRGWVTAVAFSPDGRKVLTVSWDALSVRGEARLWSAATGQPLGPPLRHEDLVNAAAFSPDGRTVLTGSDDRTARLWSAATSRPLTTLLHPGRVTAVAFSPDGKAVLTGGQDKTARLWSAAGGRPLTPPLRHQGPVTAVAFSPDGKAVLTGSADGTTRLWSAATGQPLGPPLRHEGWVAGVAFSPNGRAVLIASNDRAGTARMWDVPLPLAGDAVRIRLWLQVLTGFELDNQGVVVLLDSRGREECRRQLLQRGGAPSSERLKQRPRTTRIARQPVLPQRGGEEARRQQPPLVEDTASYFLEFFEGMRDPDLDAERARSRFEALRTNPRQLALARLTAAREWSRAKLQDVAVGRSIPDLQLLAALRWWLASELAVCETASARLEAHAGHWLLTRQMWRRAKVMYDAGKISAKDYFPWLTARLDAQIRLARARQTKGAPLDLARGGHGFYVPAEGDAEDPLVISGQQARALFESTRSREEGLARARLAAAREWGRAKLQDVEVGRSLQDLQLLAALRWWLASELAVCGTASERLAAHARHWTLTWQIWRISEVQYDAGKISAKDYFPWLTARLDAQIQMARARQTKGGPLDLARGGHTLSGLEEEVIAEYQIDSSQDQARALFESARPTEETLARARIVAAFEWIRAKLQDAAVGRSIPDLELMEAARHLLKSELAVSRTRAGRIAAHGKYLDVVRQIEATVRVQYHEGKISAKDYYPWVMMGLDAQIRMARVAAPKKEN
jgi:WD40 repeat protein